MYVLNFKSNISLAKNIRSIKIKTIYFKIRKIAISRNFTIFLSKLKMKS